MVPAQALAVEMKAFQTGRHEKMNTEKRPGGASSAVCISCLHRFTFLLKICG
jgi:hypothetical protein